MTIHKDVLFRKADKKKCMLGVIKCCMTNSELQFFNIEEQF